MKRGTCSENVLSVRVNADRACESLVRLHTPHTRPLCHVPQLQLVTHSHSHFNFILFKQSLISIKNYVRIKGEGETGKGKAMKDMEK